MPVLMWKGWKVVRWSRSCEARHLRLGIIGLVDQLDGLFVVLCNHIVGLMRHKIANAGYIERFSGHIHGAQEQWDKEE